MNPSRLFMLGAAIVFALGSIADTEAAAEAAGAGMWRGQFKTPWEHRHAR